MKTAIKLLSYLGLLMFCVGISIALDLALFDIKYWLIAIGLVFYVEGRTSKGEE